MSNSIIHSIDSLKDLQTVVNAHNPGAVIIKFGAEWCGPCKRIESFVHSCMAQTPATVQCVILDVDESFEVYAFFKNKRLINGIPAMFVYYKGSQTYVPDAMIAGTDQTQILQFFNTAVNKANSLQ